MTSEEFLRAIWPSEGFYALAKPFTVPGTTTTTYVHKVFETIDAAAKYVDRIKDSENVFFCVHSLREPRVWDPHKRDYKTGELGAYTVRTQRNMQAGRAFFFDLDVGTGERKYDSQQQAVADLRRFCKEAKLPKPLVTSSGGGVHVYWIISEALASEDWRKEASQLRALAKHHGLRADPARTTDTASVLRVVGTNNLKTGQKRPVEALTDAKVHPTGEFLKAVHDAVTRAGVQLKEAPRFDHDADDLGLGSNLAEEVFDGPPVTMKALITACRQVQRLARLRGNVSEPEWYHSINLARFTENGHVNAHKISDQHPDYDKGATDRKLLQLETKGIKPTSCAKLAEVCGDELCEGCPFLGRVKSPLVAARYKDPAPAPVVQHLIGAVTQSVALPDPPQPFTRLSSGKIAMVSTNKDGDEFHLVILDHDLYPVRRISNTRNETEQLLWRALLPPGNQPRDFILDADALYDPRKFSSAMANRGIYPKRDNVQHLQAYMIAYITELQKLTDAETQHNHLGWLDEKEGFILPDRIIMDDGSAKSASLSKGAASVAAHIRKKGTLQRQVELLQFYNHPLYVGHQFMVLCALAAPFYYASGHHGVIVSAWGDPGVSKSTALYTAAAIWGDPDLYTINGTNSGATVRARNERFTTLANLPVCVDEITKMDTRDIVDMAMNISQPGSRIRLDQTGAEKQGVGGVKSTIMLATSNRSLHAALSNDGEHATAGSMRVFEIGFRKTTVHTKPEADAYLRELKQNYGWVGETFIYHAIRHKAQIEKRVGEIMAEVDTIAHIEGSERFWSAVVAVVIAVGEVAQSLGLISYDLDYLKNWLVKRHIPHMRQIVGDVYVTPLTVLTDFLQQAHGDILVTHGPFQGSNISSVSIQPRGQLIGHYSVDEGTLWVLKKGFRDYCTRIGQNYFKIVDELSEPRALADGTYKRVITSKSIKKVLGSGTEHAKSQAWCFQIDMVHPEVAGAISPETLPPAKGKPDLKVVK